jgi:peptide subunit release factor RF-3
MTPVFFGSAVNSFGVRELLRPESPAAAPLQTKERVILPNEEKVTASCSGAGQHGS